MPKTPGVAEWDGGRNVGTIYQGRVYLGVITLELATCRGQPRIPVHIFGIKVASH